MPIRRKIVTSGPIPATKFNHTIPLCALVLGAVVLSFATAVYAQEDPKPQTSGRDSSAGEAKNAHTGKSFFNLLQEKSFVFPNIATSTEPLSAGQKFQLFVDNSISLNALAVATAGSAISQADNSPTGFGQGWDAYAKRFGSSMGRQASSEFFGTFVLASALHQDPRFYPEANPSFGRAMKYSVQRIFVTRNDDGRDVANWSGLAGPLMAEGLANVYWPERNRTVGDTFLRYGLDIATRAGGNMLREYWPVFYGKINHSSRPTAGRS
jgi:hypothetical protein